LSQKEIVTNLSNSKFQENIISQSIVYREHSYCGEVIGNSSVKIQNEMNNGDRDWFENDCSHSSSPNDKVSQMF